MIQNQVYVFLWSIVTGAFLAFMFDLFRASRKVGKFNVIKVALQDILYCILAASVIIMTSFVTNDGEIRGYMFIGYFLGVMFYLLLFSSLVLKMLSIILETIHKMIEMCLEYPKMVLKKINFKRKRLQNEKI